MKAAHRHFSRALKPLGFGGEAFAQAQPDDDLTDLAARVLRRIRLNRGHGRVAGSWVLADARGNVHILSDNAATTAPMVDSHPAMVVGHYACGTKAVFPSVAEMADDLAQHFADIGFAQGLRP